MSGYGVEIGQLQAASNAAASAADQARVVRPVSSDPHGYGVFAAVLFVAVLTPIALVLWSLYRYLRRGTE